MNVRLKKGLALGLTVSGALAVLVAAVMPPCWTALAKWGMLASSCPAGEPRVLVDVSTYGIERGREGTLYVNVYGSWIDSRWEQERTSPLNRFTWDMELDTGEQIFPLSCTEESESRGARACQLELPQEIPDGDHILRVRVDTPLEDPVVEVRVPLYAPAHVHVLTDRPLYEPGNVVLFRSLTLRRGSLEPLDSRPGSWVVTNPHGEVLLEERLPGGEWGIEQSSFPLAMDAQPGTWTVAWSTGADSGSASFEVRPFTLPRFTVEARPQQSWYAPGEAPMVRGVVNYTSGAPVQGATVEVSLRGDGVWPPPNEWLGPHLVQTDASGSFRLELPDVPDDLHAPTRLSVSIAATDPDGDRVGGGTGLLLSPDPIKVEAVTELGDGLVPEFNNRAYLRITTPDGIPLADTTVFVKNVWDVRDPGKEFLTDADGVLAAQLDPGQPVNVVVPDAPVRPPPKTETRSVQLDGASDLLARRDPTLAERRDLEAMLDDLETCARFGSGRATVGLEVRGGLIRSASFEHGSAHAGCVAEQLEGRVFGVGEAVWTTAWRFTEPAERTWIRVDNRSAGNDAQPVIALLERARRDASACVTGRRADGTLPWQAIWRVAEGTKTVQVRWGENPAGAGFWPEQGCIQRAFSGLTLSMPAEQDLLGVSSLSVDAWQPPRQQGPRTRTMTGFEYQVVVAGVGETSWRTVPGVAPALRLRPDAVLLEPGATLTVEMLRGPDWVGDLPTELTLQGHRGTVAVCARTKEWVKDNPERYEGCPSPADDNTIAFALPPEQTGFMLVEYASARAMVYVQPTSTLELEISTALSSYAPGSEAVLQVNTSQPAVVSLVGVDSTLGQLVTLPDEGELTRGLVAASSSQPAYAIWDAVALTSGRIRGSNAAMAAIQRVDSVVLADEELPWLSLSGSSGFDPVEETTSTFWEVLADLHDAVRRWESESGDELLTNEKMAEVYAGVLDRREEQGLAAEDPWGRRLELYLLPTELLELCEPRMLVQDATRVPEDIVNWPNWVQTEMER